MWQKFIEQQPGRISGKVKQRLQGLALLAVQVVAGEIDGRPDRYTYAELADMIGATADTYRKRYGDYWRALMAEVFVLDKHALDELYRLRQGLIEVKKKKDLQMSGFCL